jgi:hypothetical protein
MFCTVRSCEKGYADFKVMTIDWVKERKRVRDLYAGENYEEVKVEIPAGMSVESLPQPRRIDQGAGFYEFAPTIEGNTLRLTRTWRMSGYLLDQKQYLPLRGFYDRVLAGDAQQATLVPKPEAAAK